MSDVLRRCLVGLRMINLASLSLWREPAKLMDFLRRTNMLFLSCSHAPMLSVTLSHLLRDSTISEVFVPFRHIKPGSTPLADLSILAALAKKRCPRQVFEIGTFEGLSAVVFACNTHPSTRVYTLDLPSVTTQVQRTQRSWQAHSTAGVYRSGYLVDAFDCSEKVVRLIGDSALFDFEPWRDGIDLFFVDGAHTEDYVARDSLNAFKCISSAGWVVWHDCFIPQVLDMLKRIARYHPVYHISETSLAVAFGKPGADFAWRILHRKIR